MDGIVKTFHGRIITTQTFSQEENQGLACISASFEDQCFFNSFIRRHTNA